MATPNHSSSTLWTILPLAVAALITLLWLGCGVYQVKPGEATAEQTFGAARPEPVTEEGLHWHWPSPVGKTTTVQVRKSRTAELGFNTLPDGVLDDFTNENWKRDYQAATMITGDMGLLEIQLVAHYYISDLNSYLFRADDPGVSFDYYKGIKLETLELIPEGQPDGQTMKDALAVAIRRALGQRTIDQALISEREAIEAETMLHAQSLLDASRTGLTITSVQLQEVKPPDEVQHAFDDVLRAREERDTRINEALAFESQTLPEARGDAETLRRQAEAYRAQRINEAQAEAQRFLAIHEEYQASPDIISKRMYLETMDKVLPRTKQVIITGTDPPALIINTDPSTRTTPVTLPGN